MMKIENDELSRLIPLPLHMVRNELQKIPESLLQKPLLLSLNSTKWPEK
jgi:hypothetical protein